MLELVASKATWSNWFRRDKAFCTKTDNKTYAQAVSHRSPCISVSSPNPKVVPVKPTVKKRASNLHHCDTSTSCVHVKQPLHNKCHHVTAPVLVNNRFEVLATNTDASDAVLADTLVNKAIHQQYRACKQQAMSFGNSDISIGKLDLACKAITIDVQVSRNTSFYVLMVYNCRKMTHSPGVPNTYK